MSAGDLERWVRAVPATALLPKRAGSRAGGVATPFTLLDSIALGDGITLVVVRDQAHRRYPVPLVADGTGWRRAVDGDGAALALVRLLSSPDLAPTGRFEPTRWAVAPFGANPVERGIDVDQTNESVVVDDRAVVKWTVRSTGGREAAPSRLAALAESGFTGMPRPWGMVRWHPGSSEQDTEPLLVATVVDFLPGAVDGWQWAVEDVRALARGEIDLAAATRPAARLGALTAQLHCALPSRGPAGQRDAARWASGARAELGEAIEVVDGPEGDRLRAQEAELCRLLDRLGTSTGTQLVDTHGDLHVGQFLRWRPDPDSTEPGYAVTDFDGSPVLSAEERASPAPAAVDVAGLLQSLDHVGRVVLHRTDGVAADVVHAWIASAQSRLLGSYRSELARSGRVGLLDHHLLQPLRARQVVREYLYAVRHLPHWRYVPDAALPSLLASRSEGEP